MSCLRVDQVVSLPLHLSPLAIAIPEHIQTMMKYSSVNEESLFQVLQNRCSPNNPEVVSVEVPRLQLVLGVLEHDLDELVQVEPDDGRPGAWRRPTGA